MDEDLLLRSSYRAALAARNKGWITKPLTLKNCTMAGTKVVKDVTINSQTGLIETIREASYTDHKDQMEQVDCRGLVILPGMLSSLNLPWEDLTTLKKWGQSCHSFAVPESLVASRAASVLEGMLSRGFTSVRDAGGADWGLAQAVDEGSILGPRLLFTGHALSQTGGHALRGIGRVCDGDAEVRRAARDELRKGAHCIKVMAGGGVSSPTDRLENTQFSKAELTAIVEEARACKTYVAAHAYTSEAILRCVECGVRSIEHGNMLDGKAALAMKEANAFLVPTLVTYEMLRAQGLEAGMKPGLLAKVGSLLEQGLQAIKLASEHGIQMCYGSDLLGDLHRFQSHESCAAAVPPHQFKLRSAVLSPKELLSAATANCGELFGLKIGQLLPDWHADLLLVKGDPLSDITVLTDPSRIVMILKGGLFVKGGPLGERANKALYDGTVESPISPSQPFK